MRPVTEKTTTTESTSVTSSSGISTKEEKYPLRETKIIQPTGYPASSGAKLTAAHKLQALRQHVLEDPEISAELAYYVPPNGQSSALSTQSEALRPWIEKEFLHSNARVLLLKAPGGAGKSTFNRHLLRQLWQDPAWAEWKLGEVPPAASVPLFIPLGSSQVNPKRLLAFLSTLPEPLESFTDEEINVLKEDYHMLLIADGYDEIPSGGKLNLYDVNGLDRYAGRVKLLISSRDFIGRESVESYQLVPHHQETGRAEYRYYRERFVSPFTESQMAAYLERYLAKNKDRTDISLWTDVATYQKHFKALPELQPLITAPFLLWIAAEALPTIVQGVKLELKETEEKEPKREEKSRIKEPDIETKNSTQRERKIEVKDELKDSKATPISLQKTRKEITRLRLYAQFMEQWFHRQAEKAVAAKELLENPEALLGEAGMIAVQTATGVSGDLLAAEYLKQAYRQFCQLFADHLQASNRISVQYPAESKRRGRLVVEQKEGEIHSETVEPADLSWATELFGTTSTDWQRVRKGCPLRQSLATEHQFLHASLIDYFVATISVEQTVTVSEEKTSEKEEKDEDKEKLLTTISLLQSELIITPTSESRVSPQPDTESTPQLSTTAEPTTQSKSRKPRLAPPPDPASQRLLDQKTIGFRVDELKEQPKKKEHYEDLIERSKTDETVAIGSANAITILNAAGENLSSRDFRDVRIPGADLSGALLDSTNFSSADLSQVSLQGTWAYGINLQGAKVQGLNFGGEAVIQIEDPVSCCSVSFNGEQLAVGVGENILLFELLTHRLLRWLMGHTGQVESLAWDPSGKWLASGGQDNIVRVWDLDNKSQEPLIGHKGAVYAVDWDSQGKWLASGSADKTVRVWNLVSKREVYQFIGHIGPVYSLSWNPQNQYLASASCQEPKHDSPIDVNYSVLVKERVFGGLERLDVRRGMPNSQVSYTLNTTGIADIIIWDMVTGRGTCQIRDTDTIYSVAWHPLGAQFAYSSGDRIRIWHMVEQRQVRQLQHADDKQVLTIAWDKQGQRIASGSHDGNILIWDVATGKELRQLRGHTNNLRSVAWMGAEQLTSTSYDNTVRVWDITVKELHEFNGHGFGRVDSLAWDAKGERLASAGSDKTARIWDAMTGKEIVQLLAQENRVTAVAWDRQGKRLATSGGNIHLGGDNTVCVWDMATGAEVQRFKGHIDFVNTVDWDIKGEQLASGSDDKTIRIWNLTLCKETSLLLGHTSAVNAVVWDAQGKLLASGSSDNTIRLWDVAMEKEIYVFRGHTHYVNAVVWGMQENQLASGSWDNSVRLWDINTRKEVRKFTGHLDHVLAIAWECEGKRLASGSKDKTVRVWDTTSGQMLSIFYFPDVIYALAWQANASGSALAIAFGSSIACYQFNIKEVLPRLQWMSAKKIPLWLTGAKLTDAIGLDSMSTALLQQQDGVIGLPRETITMSKEEQHFYLGEEKHPYDYSFLLGVCYRYGYGRPIQYKKALALCMEPARQGHARAQLYIGMAYYGAMIEAAEYLARAFIEIKKQAQSKRDAWAAYVIADIYKFGKGIEKDQKEADFWYRVATPLLVKAAQKGVLQAQTWLGLTFLVGDSVERDSKMALNFFSQAAKQGFAGAQAQLGNCNKYGIGVKTNIKEAIRWFQLASEQGSLESGAELKDSLSSIVPLSKNRYKLITRNVEKISRISVLLKTNQVDPHQRSLAYLSYLQEPLESFADEKAFNRDESNLDEEESCCRCAIC